MQNYHVTPEGETWNLAEEEGALLGSYRTKEEAVQRAREYVSEHTGSLKIHKADGTIEEERTYPRAADPVESPG
jgi:hypothetical protein